MKNPKNKQTPDTQNTSKQNKVRRQQAFKQGRRAEAYAPWVLCAKGYRLLVRNFRHPLGEVALFFFGAGICWFLSRSNFAPTATPAHMPCRPPSGGAFRQAGADLLRATLIMQTMFGGLTCLWSPPWGASSTRKISGALEPTRNFGESVGRGSHARP